MLDDALAETTFDFILRCRRPDGGYAPSPDPDYAGNSDTAASDLAAATYAAVLARTLGRELPEPAQTVAFLQRHQQPDGTFVNWEGSFDPTQPLALLYNTTQGVVGLRALGQKPLHDASRTLDAFFTGASLATFQALDRAVNPSSHQMEATLEQHPLFEREAYKTLPWYTTSFFPLFYAALDDHFPRPFCVALCEHMLAHQAADGYLGDHVAATFHLAHFFRLIGEPVPRAAAMVERTLQDQTPEGGWNIKALDWDVHSCFDAVFILRQLGQESPRCQEAIRKAGEWALGCRNADGGFGHYSGWPSDMDAVYFQAGTLFQAGRLPIASSALDEGPLLGWGHAMQPDKR
jgi:geranylgeranyl transferase type-2 subunit beta